MLTSVKNGKEAALNELFKDKAKRDKMNYKLTLVFDIFSKWDRYFDLETIGGSIWNAWELKTATYFQETKIDNEDVRKCLVSGVAIDNFLYREIEHWSWEKESYRYILTFS